MKLLWLLAFVLAVVQINGKSLDQAKLYKKLKKQCANELGLDVSSVPQLFDSSDLTAEDEDHKNFYACIIDKLQVVGEDGKVDSSNYNMFMQNYVNGAMNDVEQKLDAIAELQKCKTVTSDSFITLGAQFKNCFMQARSKIFMAPKSDTPSCVDSHDLLMRYDPKRICMDMNSLPGVNVLSLSNTDPRLGHFLVCAWQHLRIMNFDGTINPHLFEDFVTDVVSDCTYFKSDPERENAIMSTVERCTSSSGVTAEQTAVGLHKCIQSTIPISGLKFARNRIETLKYSL